MAAALQKVAFYVAKGRRLASERPPFIRQNTAFCKAVCNMLAINEMANRFQFLAFLPVFLVLQPGCITFALLLYQPCGTVRGLRAVAVDGLIYIKVNIYAQWKRKQ